MFAGQTLLDIHPILMLCFKLFILFFEYLLDFVEKALLLAFQLFFLFAILVFLLHGISLFLIRAAVLLHLQLISPLLVFIAVFFYFL